MEHLKLGASLYIPAIHADLINVANGNKYPELKSLIIDTEDAITTDDLPFAYHNIGKLLNYLSTHNAPRPLIFIRVRNTREFKRVAEFDNINYLDGFVMPKFSEENMHEYMEISVPGKYYMPILEKNIFSLSKLESIRDFLLEYRSKILSVRIGATDLLSCLNLRRDSYRTIYEIAIINQIISNIVITFKPYGFNITGPVWESFCESTKTKLQEEVKLDLLNGLFGKTIIHPWQIEVVQEMYKVDYQDYEIAQKLLDPYSPAVFKAYERMNEKATHTNWAEKIVEMAKIYGVKEG